VPLHLQLNSAALFYLRKPCLTFWGTYHKKCSHDRGLSQNIEIILYFYTCHN